MRIRAHGPALNMAMAIMENSHGDHCAADHQTDGRVSEALRGGRESPQPLI